MCRKGGLRSAEELQRTIVDIETKYKSELGRAKKKYESDYRELEIQNENLSRANAELAKANKSLAGRVKVTDLSSIHSFFISFISFIKIIKIHISKRHSQ